MRAALDIVRDLVDEEQRLAQRQLADGQRLEVVRAQLGALRRLAGVETSARPPRSSGPTRAAASSAARPTGRKAARARRAPRRARPLAPPAGERPVRAEVIARAARGQAIRELIARARVEEPAPAPAAAAPEPPSSSSSARSYSPRRTDKLEPGATFGCWTVLREAPPDSYGRVLYRARASCCGVEANKGRNVLERGRAACTKCVDRTQQGIDQPVRARGKRGPNACKACGTRHGNKKDGPCAAQATSESPWVRCKLSVEIATGAANQQAQAFTTCGSLVLRKKCAGHLADVHGLEVAVADVGRHFGQVDPKQGAAE